MGFLSPFYLNVPMTYKSASFTLSIDDAEKCILHEGGDNVPRTWTIPDDPSMPFPVRTTIHFINIVNTVTINIIADTLFLAGTGAVGPRQLAAFGVAQAHKIGTNAWLISGTGLS